MYIVFQGRKAVGVYFVENGVGKFAYARKCVVIAAGHRSSFLLENSGVGDPLIIKKYLTAIGRPMVSNVPGVGESLGNDGVVLATLTRNTSDPLSPDANSLYAGGAFLDYPGGYSGTGTKRFSQWLNLDAGPGIFLIGAILVR